MKNELFDIKELENFSKKLRITVLKMLNKAGSGHTGGSLSCVEILVALYKTKLQYNPKEPKWENRDRFVLSKGHAAPTLYALLAAEGFFPEQDLYTLRTIKGLQGHPTNLTAGIEIATGSLGQGLSVANGMALAGKMDDSLRKVYVLLGDGELQEGQVWEAAMTAAHYKLDNLCAIVDANKLQIDGKVSEIMNIEPLIKKWEAFGWKVFNIDGHNFDSLLHTLNECEKVKNTPFVIIANTIKGKGVSFMENKAEWHGVAPNDEQLKKALLELKEEV